MELKSLPVTLLSGFCDTSKYALIKKVAENTDNLKVLIFACHLEKLHLDESKVEKKTDEQITLKNKCLIVKLTDLFFEQLSDHVLSKEFDYCLLETNTYDDLEGMKEMFLTDLDAHDEEHEHTDECEHSETTMNQLAPISNIATVVDAATIVNDIRTEETLVDRFGEKVPGAENRHIPFLIVSQIEDAKIIVINNAEKAENIEEVQALIKKINGKAKVFTAKNCDISPKELFGTELFSLTDSKSQVPSWLSEIKGEIKSETISGISSFVYRRRKPFHTEKIYKFIYGSDYLNKESGVIRSRGLIWLCTRNDDCCDWNHVAQIAEITNAGKFFSSLDEEIIADLEPEMVEELKANCEGPHGDRRCDLLFIGKNMNQKEIEQKLDECLISDEDLAKGPTHYETMCEDEFPEFEELDHLLEDVSDDEEDEEEDKDADIDITSTPKRKRNDDSSKGAKKTKKD
ncbi:predicted protein [Naegleria gruberi]|uniref:Predicted protein n=1 Tax=Naegleria gruberi TaxID=5762 RepID=D2UZV5_NAEGR|nr:uncharacterized protein NAEGRDRAFT_77978 [Naegleria gruberi]EFC50000.1 predicted protein [Naegleria gruberi]|eukprot:XP_002682744.1 predicted protein [Naegleria gruberi strain NEG-M]